MRLRWDVLNALSMCQGHHLYYTLHPDKWFLDFIPTHFVREYQYVNDHKNEIVDTDYETLIQQLTEAIETL